MLQYGYFCSYTGAGSFSRHTQSYNNRNGQFLEMITTQSTLVYYTDILSNNLRHMDSHLTV